MKSSIFQATLLLPAIAVAGAIGFAASASAPAAWAQGDQGAAGGSNSAASEPASVPGVVVQAPKPNGIPADKKAALDAKAAKRKAWTSYSKTAPVAVPSTAAPGTASASSRAGNYPGLHDLGSR
jgi:hypothetical protein